MAAPLRRSTRQLSNADLAAEAAADYRQPRSCCGGRLVIVESFGRSGAPPAPLAGSRDRDALMAVTASSQLQLAGNLASGIVPLLLRFLPTYL